MSEKRRQLTSQNRRSSSNLTLIFNKLIIINIFVIEMNLFDSIRRIEAGIQSVASRKLKKSIILALASLRI